MSCDRRRGDRHKLIMLVDDDFGLCELVATCLSAVGFRVAIAHDGVGVVERAIREEPHAIVLDLEMPGLDGRAVLRALKFDARTRTIPVVMFSGSATAGWQAVAIRDGSATCLAKPSSPESLLEAVRCAMRHPPS